METHAFKHLEPAPNHASEGALDSAVASRFVQKRLALFAKVISAFAVVYIVMAGILAVRGVEPFFKLGRESHFLAAAIAGAMWFITARSRQLSASFLKLVDTSGTLALAICLVVMGYLYGLSNPWGYLAGLLSIFHLVLTRAIIVPSSPRRTLIVTALSFTGLVLSQALAKDAPGAAPGLRDSWLALIGPLFTGGTGTALATLASAVIYGLHRDVSKARQLGQYTLEERIGSGGMGEVYRARHAMLRRPTAIKLLTGGGSERELRRFEQEVQLTARLTHPNTISIFDYGRTPDGKFYYAMELLDGVTLEELVERYGTQPPGRVINVMAQVCAALREAHGAGLIHRDIKPANIFLCRHGGLPDVIKVLDFGLVKELASASDISESATSQLIGTPLYLAPEAIASPDLVNERSDLYALGAVGYYLLAGAPVFPGQSVIEVLGHHLHSEPEPPSRRSRIEIAPDLEATILTCLAKAPRERPASAQELASRLQACSDAGTWREVEAEAWWQAHMPVSNGGARDLPGPRRTLSIALDGRFATNEKVTGEL